MGMLRNSSIRKKLTILCLVATFAALLIVCCAFFTADYITFRRMMVQAARDLEKGIEPPGADPDTYWDVRAVDSLFPKDVDWRDGARDSIGLGEAMGRALCALEPKHRAYSLLCAAYEARMPFTAHVTIGGDIAHFHPDADGAALGATSHTDFRLLAELVRRMNGGGVYLNIGSAVTLPEVFLKCVTLVRNLSHPLNDITTANFDFIQSYRPLTNVVRRPTAGGAGRGYSITGHHELTIPLLAAFLICRADSKD